MTRTLQGALRGLAAGAAFTAAGILAAAPGAAQIGAIGAVPGVGGGDGTFAGAPIFTESAAVLPQGRLSVGAHFATVSQSLGIQGTDIDVRVSQMLAGIAYSPLDRLMIGLRVSPYIQLEASSQFGSLEETGRGDAWVDARYQLWEAPSGRTRLAGNASLQLPVGDDDFGAAGTALGLGAAVSHQLDAFSLHGGLGATIPANEDDGKTAINFSGAGVLSVSPRVWLSVELIGATASGEHVLNLAPGARVNIGRSLFLDAGVLVNASSSAGQAPFDNAFILGISFVP